MPHEIGRVGLDQRDRRCKRQPDRRVQALKSSGLVGPDKASQAKPRGLVREIDRRDVATRARQKSATETAIRAATGRAGEVTCRFTHVYPDGPAPDFTFHALGEPGNLGAQWLAIKSAAFDAVIDNGGTITHHHAVGRDHRPWYDRQRPPLFAAALRAAKKALDPQGLLNPGVPIDP